LRRRSPPGNGGLFLPSAGLQRRALSTFRRATTVSSFCFLPGYGGHFLEDATWWQGQ